MLFRSGASATLTFMCAQADVWGVRVHDVRSSADAIAVAERMGA